MIKMTDTEARSILRLSQSNSADFRVMMGYFKREHEDSRNKLEDSSSDTDLFRAQGVSRTMRSIANIGKDAENWVKLSIKKQKQKQETSLGSPLE